MDNFFEKKRKYFLVILCLSNQIKKKVLFGDSLTNISECMRTSY